MALLVFNERSWAIDLISEINSYSKLAPISVNRATGEAGLRGGKSTLFPDVILHGEDGILQGWELKLPDTDINDTELLHKAAEKAVLLGVNSFLVWNGREASLWAQSKDSETFNELKTWVRPTLVDRKQVEQQRSVWVEMMKEILTDLEFFLTTGVIAKRPNTSLLDEAFVSKIVEALYDSDAQALEKAALKSEVLRQEIDEWVIDNSITQSDRFVELAKTNILSWTNRFIFCHYLSQYNPIALKIREIKPEASISDVKVLFDQISAQMDFANVFVPGIGDEVISTSGWLGRMSFNELLTRAGISEMPEDSMRNVLEEFSSASRRKSQGQFATPRNLALAVAQIAMDDLTGDVSDPCCGSGTIAKALYEVKIREGVDYGDALESVWASDKYQMPLQLTSINLSDPRAITALVQVFKSNVFSLKTGMGVELVDPKLPGSTVTKDLPPFSAIASNLPFVRQEVLEGQGLSRVYQDLEKSGVPNARKEFGKADLYAAIILDLERILDNKGRIVVIVSNSWMGTSWGSIFQDQLRRVFHLRAVIKSGEGRWFKNAAVVSTIIVLEKRTPEEANREVNFVTTNRPLEAWDSQFASSLKLAALKGKSSPDIFVTSKGDSILDSRRKQGFYWRVNFFDSPFLEEFLSRTVPMSKHFHIARGARTGLDAFFHPDSDSLKVIEAHYLIPLLKSSKGISRLKITPNDFAFSCSRTLEELKDLGHTGAISWIKKFENRVNGKGEKLVSILEKQHKPWYFLNPSETGDFAMSLNPFESLSVYRADSPIFINQRLIRLTSNFQDKELLHALLNSCFGMLAMEFLGFGRGEGVLDLRSDAVKEDMHMLDPSMLSNYSIRRIKDSFKPLLNRDVKKVFSELESQDRIDFEKEVLSAFNLSPHFEDIARLLTSGVSERLLAGQRGAS